MESVALGGYYKTPTHLLPHIGRILETQTEQYSYGSYPVLDPCAGEGEAVIKLAELIHSKAEVYACELETTRHATLKSALEKRNWKEGSNCLQGDAFRIDVVGGQASCLYLNPPYDTDPIHGRLEHRFLSRFATVLDTGGVLVFVVPHYALKASADLLSREFEDLTCIRFPEEDFSAYKQVVLFARKTDAHEPDPEVLAQVLAWAEDVSDTPVLGEEDLEGAYTLKSSYFQGWKMRAFDLTGLLALSKPWRMTTRLGVHIPIPQILPEGKVEDLMFREYPIATNPRPAHIAAGIASGLFNGRKVTSENAKLPDLLVKGVFDREYKTVEEKHNKDGEVTGMVQVQQPKLVTTVLDLTTKKYTTLKTAGKTGSLKVSEMSIEDLLDHYGPSLMRVMSEQCPVTYDPKRDAGKVTLSEVGRKLFDAQEHASKALVSLLGGPGKVNRRGKAAILLGEIGSGKTSCALAVGKTIARRMLVMCPPHLLQSWTDEAAKVLPEVVVRVLEDPADVDALRDVPKDKFLLAILSRETGKLGHGWEGVTGFCPKCGANLPDEDLAKKRSRCGHKPVTSSGPFFDLGLQYSLWLGRFFPKDVANRPFLRTRLYQNVIRKRLDAEFEDWAGFDSAWVAKAIDKVVSVLETGEHDGKIVKLLCQLLIAENNEARIATVIRKLRKVYETSQGYYWESILRQLCLLLRPESELQNQLIDEGAFRYPVSYYSRGIESYVANVKEADHHSDHGSITWKTGTLIYDEMEPGSSDLATEILASLFGLTTHVRSEEECGEPLFQAIPSPRRYPLAKYISRYGRDLFDFLVLDESHEYSNTSAAQTISANRLSNLGLPTIWMTGSAMNGYAISMFNVMWAISPDFRNEFQKDEEQRYIDRYGYRKRLISERDRETKEIVSFGTHTDRVETSERIIGDAPGILPLFLFRHLLKYSVTLHKADLAINLPKCHQFKQTVVASPELMAGYETLKNDLVRQIKKDRFEPEKAGKLFGALAELPSYLDRATLDTGNQDNGLYEIRYPESLDRELVSTGASFPADTLSAKEEWMLETIRAELAEDRNVMVFCWHVSLLPRLARIISEAIGEDVPILYADKVPTGKRQAWIDSKVVKKGRRVMVANPVCIQTGLNNLVHFATEVWMENPACNPFIFRQAIGRVDRINQKLETRIYIPVYANTLQEQLYDLLMRKVAVSISTDGLDPESALMAAGIAEDSYLTGLSIGKQLWSMLEAS